MEPMEQSTPATKRSSMACTTCRQVKLRCDAMKRFPAACSRCQKKKSACLFDSGFKRQVMRGAFEKATEENQQLQKLVQSLGGTGLDPGVTTPTTTTTTTTTTAVPPAQLPVEGLGKVAVTSGSLSTSIFELDQIYLDGQTMHDIFEHFHRHYLHHLPILDISKPIGEILKESHLLFWAVVITSLYRHPLHSHYFAQLYQPFRRLLSDQMVVAIQSIHTVQALLLLCAWPLPVVVQREDPSWNYCSLAASAAMQMALDEPPKPSDSQALARDNEIRRLKTWAGCFVVTTTLAADLGQPPPMIMVANREARVRQRLQGLVPEDFLSQSYFQRYSVRAANALYGLSSSPLQSSLIDVLDRDLANTADQFLSSPVQMLRIDVLAAKLRLYALPLLSRNRPDPNGSDTEIEAILFKGFHIALQLTDVITQAGIAQPDGKMLFYPKHYIRVLIMATMYIISFIALDRAVHARDKVLAQASIKKVYEALRGYSIAERDEADRAAAVIELLSRHAEDAASADCFKETDPNTTNIIDDGVKIARKIRRMKGRASTSSVMTPHTLESGSINVAGVPGLQTDQAMVLASANPPDWDSWVPDPSDLMELLGPQSNSLWMPEEWM